MPRTRAFYSVVQYVPDPGRAEAANAGVALFLPAESRIEVRVSPTLARVRQFFTPGKTQFRRIELAVASLRHRLEAARGEFRDEGEFAHFVAARADAVRLTPPRLVVVEDVPDDLTELYDELVGEYDRRADEPVKGRSLPPRLAEVLGRLEAVRKVWRPGSIPVPTVRRKFAVTFAYQNGATNYVRAEALGKGDKRESMLEKLGFNGQLIQQHPVNDQSAQLIVLSADPGAKPETEQEFERALKEFHVRFVPYAQADEFGAEVEKTAH